MITVMHILVSETLKIDGAAVDDAAKRLNERNKGLIYENCAAFTDCISKRNNTQIDNAKDYMLWCRCIT